MCWQMELPMIDVAAIKANCSSCVENYHVCEMLCHWVPGCYEADFVCCGSLC